MFLKETMKLIHGDCLEEMPKMADRSVDMILTDPPYGMDFQSNYRILKHEKIENDNGLGWLDDFSREAFRVAKDDSAHYFFCSFHHIDLFKQALQKHFKVKNILIWEKNNTSMGDLQHDFAPKCEFIIFCQKGLKAIRGKRDPNIMRFPKTGNNLHPTEKPVELMSYLIEKFADEGDIICDPFMGSGTMGVAAINQGCDFIGFENNDIHFQTAKTRIGNRLSEGALF